MRLRRVLVGKGRVHQVKARIIDPDDEWPGRVGTLTRFTGGNLLKDRWWVQFDNGEGGEYRVKQIELLSEDEAWKGGSTS